MATVVVSTVAALAAALKIAHGGDVIQLAPGTYSGVEEQHLPAYSSTVTITSQDPNNQAKLTDLALAFDQNITVDHVEMDGSDATRDNVFSVFGSNNITWSHVHVHGPVGPDPAKGHALILFRQNHNVALTDSEIDHGLDLFGHLNNTGLTLARNYFHDTGSDIIRGGCSSNVLIADNRLTKFSLNPALHPDAIQFWTTGCTTAPHDIEVTGNMIERGSGSGAFQGIFLGNELKLRYSNVKIVGNSAYGAGITCVGVGIAENVDVERNTCQPFVDTSSPHNANNEIARIMISDVTGTLVIKNNKASQYGTRDTGASMAKSPGAHVVSFDSSNAVIRPVRAR